MERRRQLAEPRIKRQRQCGQQRVLRSVLKVRSHALGTSHHIAMRQHHALGLTRASRSVKNGGHIGINYPVTRLWRAAEQVAPRGQHQRARDAPAHSTGHVLGCVGRIRGRLSDHYMAQVMALRQNVFHQRETLRRSHEHANIAVAQNEGHLLWFEQRIDRHKYRPGCGHPKTGNNGFKPLFKINGNPFTARQPQFQQPSSELADASIQIAVTQVRGATGQCNRLRRTLRSHGYQFGQECGLCHTNSKKNYAIGENTFGQKTSHNAHELLDPKIGLFGQVGSRGVLIEHITRSASCS